uniref:uncharacterized protein isoform X1 n=1 Tax=Myxine glutinosa TaxID=7769 RepID=UPI00358FA044
MFFCFFVKFGVSSTILLFLIFENVLCVHLYLTGGCKPSQNSVNKDQLTEEKEQNEDGNKKNEIVKELQDSNVKNTSKIEDDFKMEKLMKKGNGNETEESRKNARIPRKLEPMKIYTVTAEVGDTATLPCDFTVQSNEADIDWLFVEKLRRPQNIIDYIDGAVLRHNERVEFIGDYIYTKGDGSITIADLHLNDSGMYICEWFYPGTVISFHDNHILVNLVITETTVPPPPPPGKRATHVVAGVVVPLIIIGAVAGALLYCRHKKKYCWRRSNGENTGREAVSMHPLQANV